MTQPEAAASLSDSDQRTGILAGSGALPVYLAHHLQERGEQPFIVRIEGECDDALQGFDGISLALERSGRLIPALKAAGVTRLILAGGISRRPKWYHVRWSLSLLRVLPKALSALRAGDDALLRGIIGYLDAEGITVVGAHEVIPELLSPDGVVGTVEPTKSDWAAVAEGLKAARAIGELDVGQAAVVFGTRAVALEGIEGTDGLLERVRSMRDHGRIASTRRGVLVKCAKPGQDERADLPTIGPNTIIMAHAAGLSGVAVEAGRSLILDHDELVAAANRLGLFVAGVREDLL